MTAPARLTKHEIAAAINSAAETGARRVVIEDGRIVIEYAPVDEAAPAEDGSGDDAWAGAA